MNLVAPSARLIDAATGAVLGGAGLAAEVGRHAAAYAGFPPGVVFARSGTSVPAVLRYAGALRAQRPVALLDPALDPAVLADFVRRFSPAVVVALAEGGAGADPGERPGDYRAVDVEVLGPGWVRERACAVPPHPDRAVLLAIAPATPGMEGLLRSVGSFAIAMTVGMFAFLSPSGLGVREAVLVAALAPFLEGNGGVGAAMGIALASRLIFTIADVLAAGLAALSGVRQLRPAAPAEAATTSAG
ncbi:hypothetical protein QLR68_16710 [Micromonospora sp. DH15]|nr:hypothetical protein [Micromonospora sp. DH15]